MTINTFKKEDKIEVKKITSIKTPRGIVRPVIQGRENVSITVDKDFKIGPYGSVEIVETGKTDWQALVQSRKDSCGLVHAIEMAKKMGIDPKSKPFAYNEDEAMVDPGFTEMTLSEVQENLSKSSTKNEELDRVASLLGVKVDDLVTAHLEGKLDSFIQEHLPKEEAKLKEGE